MTSEGDRQLPILSAPLYYVSERDEADLLSKADVGFLWLPPVYKDMRI